MEINGASQQPPYASDKRGPDLRIINQKSHRLEIHPQKIRLGKGKQSLDYYILDFSVRPHPKALIDYTILSEEDDAPIVVNPEDIPLSEWTHYPENCAEKQA